MPVLFSLKNLFELTFPAVALPGELLHSADFRYNPSRVISAPD
jgi:hypothetical protein